MKQNNHNTHFYSIQEVERCLKSTEDFEDGEQLFYFIGALRYVYDENKKKDKEIERLNNKIKEQNLLLIEFQDMEQKVDIYKSRCEKANDFIDNYDVFKEFSFPLMKRDIENQIKSSIDYEFNSTFRKKLKNILNVSGENE